MSQLNIFLYLAVAGALPATLIAGALLAAGKRRTPTVILMAMVSVQFLLSLPAGIYQGLVAIEQIQDKPALLRLVVAPAAAPFNTGGWSVSLLHDSVSPRYAGAENPGMPAAFRTFHIYLLFWLFQTALISWAAYIQYRKRQIRLSSIRGKTGWQRIDPALAAGAALFLLNSLAGANWPWWQK